MVSHTTTVDEFLAPMWMELSFLVFFALGFLFLRFDGFFKKTKTKQRKATVDQKSLKLHKAVEADISAGQHQAAINTWRAARSQGPSSIDTLKLVTQAYCALEPNNLVDIIDHIDTHRASLATSYASTAVLDVIGKSGHVNALREMADLFKNKLMIHHSTATYEVLLEGFASIGDEKSVASIYEEMSSTGHKITPKCNSVVIKGFLKKGLADASLREILEMRESGFSVPSIMLTQLIRVSCEDGKATEIFDRLTKEGFLDSTHKTSYLSPEAASSLLENCLNTRNVALARRVEDLSRKLRVRFTSSIYDSLLKIYAISHDAHAFTIFSEMKESGQSITEGLIVGVVARCAESSPKFIDFAEEVAKFAKDRKQKTLLVYSALMKVYAHAGLFQKACDLYYELTEDGLEPDCVMYGCLMKFAAECGQTALSRQLSEKAPSLDIKNYMSLIRAAGRDRDVDAAFKIFDRLNGASVKMDVAVHNCVLDVCASCGEMARACKMVEDMEKTGLVDVITYNTLIKGYCQQGNLQAARSMFDKMQAVKVEPNDISYNLYLNAAIRLDFAEAWRILDTIEKKGLIDHYTISILMKELKKSKVKNPDYLRRAFTILERAKLDLCSDEVLLSTAIEACIKFRDMHRLDKLVSAYRASKLRPSISVYGSLIKAASMMRRVDICWEFWQEAVKERSLKPSDIALGCMLDALVSNSCVNDAVELFSTWKGTVKPNTVMYSTLAKGFANTRQPARAMDLWHDMCAQKISINTVTCNAIIDAQARSGLMDEVSEIVAVMEKEGCRPDVITLSTVIKGYCVKGDVDRAFEVFRNTQKNGFVTDSIIYNTLLDGCLRRSRMELADTLIEEMEERGVVPSNHTLGIVVRMYGRRNQLQKAFDAIEVLSKKHDIRVNTEVKTCLISACINNHEIDRALDVFDDLRKNTPDLDSKIYVTLVSGCIRFGRLSEAVGLVEDAYGLKAGKPVRGLKKEESLEKDLLEHLLTSIDRKGMFEKLGSPLLTKLAAAKVPVARQLVLSMGSEAKRPNGRSQGNRHNARVSAH